MKKKIVSELHKALKTNLQELVFANLVRVNSEFITPNYTDDTEWDEFVEQLLSVRTPKEMRAVYESDGFLTYGQVYSVTPTFDKRQVLVKTDNGTVKAVSQSCFIPKTQPYSPYVATLIDPKGVFYFQGLNDGAILEITEMKNHGDDYYYSVVNEDDAVVIVPVSFFKEQPIFPYAKKSKQ